MGKKKKGRLRGRGGSQGYNSHGGNGYRPRPMRPPANGDPARNQEPQDNGEPGPVEPGGGVLEMHPNGYGFLRDPKNNYLRELTDPFVPGSMIDKFGLREGVFISGMVQAGRRQQGPRLREVLDVDGMPPEDYKNVKAFDVLTPINPEFWLRLETGPEPMTTRVMDLLTPLGKGQRALIVSPPRAGKTILLQHISHGISTNYPGVKLIVLLIDERPEEVTDMRRAVNGEVVASSLDRDIESHVRLSQLVVERCKRLAEMGKDVVLLLGFDHPPGPGVQQVGGQHRPHHERRRRHQGHGHPQEALRHGPALRGGRFVDHRRHRVGRHRQPHGRVDLPGVQGHGQHGVGVGPQVGRPARLAGHRHFAIGHAARGEAAAAGHASRGDDVASHAFDDAPGGRDGAIDVQAGEVPLEPRFHRVDRRGENDRLAGRAVLAGGPDCLPIGPAEPHDEPTYATKPLVPAAPR